MGIQYNVYVNPTRKNSSCLPVEDAASHLMLLVRLQECTVFYGAQLFLNPFAKFEERLASTSQFSRKDTHCHFILPHKMCWFKLVFAIANTKPMIFLQSETLYIGPNLFSDRN